MLLLAEFIGPVTNLAGLLRFGGLGESLYSIQEGHGFLFHVNLVGKTAQTDKQLARFTGSTAMNQSEVVFRRIVAAPVVQLDANSQIQAGKAENVRGVQ